MTTNPPSVPSALSPIARKPLYERLVEHFRVWVVEAGLSAGQRLPSARELAEGAFLRAARLDSAPMAELVKLKSRLPDILDSREAIQVKLAELAAVRRDDADIQACEISLAQRAREISQGELGEAGDQEFHTSVASAARSRLLERMYGILIDDIAASRPESLSRLGRPKASLEQHQRILEGVRAGDGQAAALAMREHLRSVGSVELLRCSASPHAE